MNAIDDCLNNRVIAAAVHDPVAREVRIVLDGGELLTVRTAGWEGDLPKAGEWSYETNPHPRTLLGLGAPTRPRGGHGRPSEDREPVVVAGDDVGRSWIFACRKCSLDHAVDPAHRTLDCACGARYLFLEPKRPAQPWGSQEDYEAFARGQVEAALREPEEEPRRARNLVAVTPREVTPREPGGRRIAVAGHPNQAAVPDGVYERVGD